MVISVKKINEQGNIVDFHATAESADFNQELENWYQKKSKTIKIDGFRPGKTPLGLIKTRYAGDAKEHAINTFLTQAVRTIMKDYKLKVADSPKISIDKASENEGFECNISYECLPQITLKDFSQINCEELSADVEPKELDEALQNLLKKHESYEKEAKNSAADWQDKVKILLKETDSNQEFEHNEVVLREDKNWVFYPLCEALYKKAANDEIQCLINFPKDYFDKKLSGKSIKYTAKVLEIFSAVKWQLDVNFAKEFECENVEALKEKMLNVLKNDRNRLLGLYHKRQVLDALDASYEFELPNSMVEREFNFIWDRLQEEIKNAKENGESQDDLNFDEIEKEYRDISKRRVKLGLIISEIAQVNDIKLTKEEINQALIKEAIRYNISAKEVASFYSKNHEALEKLTSPLLEDKVSNFVFEKSNRKQLKVKAEDLPKKLKGIVPGYGDDEE